MQKTVKRNRRGELTPEQREDSKRLKALFEARSTLSQDAFAQAFDLKSQSLVGQYLNGAIPLNLTAALRFARGLAVDISAFSPSLGAEIEHLTKGDTHVLAAVLDVMDLGDRIEALEFLEFKLQKVRGTEALRKHFAGLIQTIKETEAKKSNEQAARNSQSKDPTQTWPLKETPWQSAQRERREMEGKPQADAGTAKRASSRRNAKHT